MGSKGSQTSTQTMSYAPNPGAMSAYNNVLDRAQNVANLPYVPYEGELVAPVNAQQYAGIGNINQYAESTQPGWGAAQGLALGAAQPLTYADINQYQNPWTQQVVNATEQQFADMNAQQLQQVKGNAIAQGALGNDREGIAETQLAKQQAIAQAPVIAGLESQGYQQGVNTALAEQQARLSGALGLGNILGGSQSAALTGANAQVGAGSLEQQTQQQADLAAYQQFMQAQGFPYQQTQWLAGIDTGVGSQMGGTGTGTMTKPAPSPWAQIAGLGISALGMFGADGGRVPSRDSGGYIPTVGLSAGHTMPDRPMNDDQGQSGGSGEGGGGGGGGGQRNPGAFGRAMSGLGNFASQVGSGVGSLAAGVGAGIGNAASGFGEGIGHAIAPVMNDFYEGGSVPGYDDGGGVPSMAPVPYSGRSFIPGNQIRPGDFRSELMGMRYAMSGLGDSGGSSSGSDLSKLGGQVGALAKKLAPKAWGNDDSQQSTGMAPGAWMPNADAPTSSDAIYAHGGVVRGYADGGAPDLSDLSDEELGQLRPASMPWMRPYAPNMERYLTTPTPPPDIRANAAGKVPPADYNPNRIPAMGDVVNTGLLAIPGGEGEAFAAGMAPRIAEGIAPRVPESAQSLAGRFRDAAIAGAGSQYATPALADEYHDKLKAGIERAYGSRPESPDLAAELGPRPNMLPEEQTSIDALRKQMADIETRRDAALKPITDKQATAARLASARADVRNARNSADETKMRKEAGDAAAARFEAQIAPVRAGAQSQIDPLQEQITGIGKAVAKRQADYDDRADKLQTGVQQAQADYDAKAKDWIENNAPFAVRHPVWNAISKSAPALSAGLGFMGGRWAGPVSSPRKIAANAALAGATGGLEGAGGGYLPTYFDKDMPVGSPARQEAEAYNPATFGQEALFSGALGAAGSIYGMKREQMNARLAAEAEAARNSAAAARAAARAKPVGVAPPAAPAPAAPPPAAPGKRAWPTAPDEIEALRGQAKKNATGQWYVPGRGFIPKHMYPEMASGGGVRGYQLGGMPMGLAGAADMPYDDAVYSDVGDPLPITPIADTTPTRDPMTRYDVMSGVRGAWGDAGMSPNGISGVLYNIGQESKFNPYSREADQPHFGGEAHFAHGLYQEGGDEWNRYQRWLDKRGQGDNWRDPSLQNDFAAWNLKTNYRPTWDRMQNARSPEEAAQIYAREYLKPAAGPMHARMNDINAGGVRPFSDLDNLPTNLGSGNLVAYANANRPMNSYQTPIPSAMTRGSIPFREAADRTRTMTDAGGPTIDQTMYGRNTGVAPASDARAGLFGIPISQKARDAIIAAGLGMAASDSPRPLQALGQGALMGFGVYQQEKAAESAREMKQQEIDARAKQLQTEAQQHADTLAETKSYHQGELELRRNPPATPYQKWEMGKPVTVTDESGTTYSVVNDPKTGKWVPWTAPETAPSTENPTPGSSVEDRNKAAETALQISADEDKKLATLPQELVGPTPNRNEDFLKTLKPFEQADVRGLVDYKINPMSISTKGNRREHMLSLALQYDPSFDQRLYNSSQRGITEFFAGGPQSPAGIMTAGNTAVLHAGEMSDAIEKLKSQGGPMAAVGGWGIPFISYRAAQLHNAATRGTPEGAALAEFETARQRFTEEVTKFYSGSGGSEAERDRAIQLLDSAKSLPELRSAIAKDAQLMKDKVAQMQTRLRTSMGPTAWRQAVLKDNDGVLIYNNSKEALDRIAKRAQLGDTPSGVTPAASAPAPAATATPGGHWYRGQRAPTPAPVAAPPAMQKATTPEEAMKIGTSLPKGTQFMLPDGRIGTAIGPQ